MTDLALPPPPRSSQARPWLWVIFAILLTAFDIVVAGLQWQQYSLLNGSLRYESGNIVWTFFQLEVEYLKLRDTLLEIDHDPARLDRDALQTRYDIFVSRVALVEPARTIATLELRPIQAETVARVEHFIAAADVFLGTDAARPFDAAVARSLLSQLELLRDPVHDMSQWANDAMHEQVGARSELVRQHNRISIALMVFQSLLTILFIAVVVRQFRTLEQRGSTLERLATRLQEARGDAEAASRTKSAFLANMSHELRTPFQGVLGMLTLIEDGPLNAQQADQLRTARESAQHLLALLNDVLDASTLEHGTLKLAPVPTALHRLLGEVEALMRTPARVKGLALNFHCHDDVPVYVLADGTRLKQILFNLLGNAIKFTDAGEVVLDTGIEAGASDIPLLRFTVSDTGIGMDEAALGRLFQRFSQGDETTSRRFGGTGLGLEISRNLARMMGADIEVTSQPGLGSSFTLRVPLTRCQSPAGNNIAPASLNTRPLRVLVADDHPVNRKYIQALLARLGHQVTLRDNGQLALEAAAHEEFDLVLMDLHMPVMDGIAATLAIRALPPPHGAVPIIALTADAFSETRERATQAGMNDFLSKPVQPTELQEALGRLFGAAVPAPATASGRAYDPPPSDPANGQPPSFVAAAPWLDLSVPASVYGNLPQGFHASLLDGFFDDESGSIARLLSCLDGPIDTAMREAAHAVRGGALSLGLPRIAEVTGAIEALADDAGNGQSSAWREKLLEALAHSRNACINAGWIAAPPAPAPDAAPRQASRILVAEDNATSRSVIVRQLALLGYSTDTAADGREALERWRGGGYALLLTDLHMPNMDGYALTRTIRTGEKDGVRMPIIALSANATIGEAENCRAAGVDDYLTKPSPQAELKSTLEKWLGCPQSARGASAPSDASSASAEPAAQPVPAAAAAPLDVSVLKELVGDDPDFIRTFLQDFRAKAIATRGELRVACHSGEATAVVLAAHNLKSLARTVGAFELGALCETMEIEGRGGDMDALTMLLPSFEAKLVVVERYLDRM